MRLTERLAKEKQPRKWGFIPRFRSGEQDRLRLNEIARLARGPKYAPRALTALAEIAHKDSEDDEAIDALERLVNLYPESHYCEKAYYDLAVIHEAMVAGADYDQGATLKALNFYEDYLILHETPPPMSRHENNEEFAARLAAAKERLVNAEEGRQRISGGADRDVAAPARRLPLHGLLPRHNRTERERAKASGLYRRTRAQQP